MKIILQQNIEKLGSIGDIVEVKAGFARNYLIPKNLAFSITSKNKKEIATKTALITRKKDEAINRIKDLIEQIHSCVIAIPMKTTNDGERLYGSVNQKMIKDTLEAQGIDVNEGNISISEQIKSLGNHQVRFNFEYELKLEKTVSVTNEELEKEE